MQQIADWLEKLGMSEYAERFAENGIDVSVLRYLTDQDLEKIGVLLGHRRKMLAAIAKLDSSSPDDTSAAASAAPGPASAPPNAAAVARSRGSRRRASARHGDVLRSGGLDRDCREARRRGMARSGWSLSRRRLGGSDGNGRQGRQEARRRVDGAVRLSSGAGERRRACSAGGARDPPLARRAEPKKRGRAQARTCCARCDRFGACGGRRNGRDIRRRAERRGASAGFGRAGLRRCHSAGAASSGWTLRCRRARQP